MSMSDGYEAIASEVRHTDAAPKSVGTERMREIIRYATLAPSSHNTQCWRFGVNETSITLFPDLSRRCPAVDPDDHHMFVSLGCAAENLVHAAMAHGLHAEVYFDEVQDSIHVQLSPTTAQASALFLAIPLRQVTRCDYDGHALTLSELDLLQRAGSGPKVQLVLLTEHSVMEKVLEQVVQANTSQIADPQFVHELKSWIRFNSSEAVLTRDGLFSLTSGNPAIPNWLGRLAFSKFFTPEVENDKIASQIRSSSGIAVFIGLASNKAHWVNVGRCYERFALQATALGIRNAFLNQPVEVQSQRTSFTTALRLGDHRPDLVVRFGRGPKMPPSLRRPVAEVLV
jgi:hypothetical protein